MKTPRISLVIALFLVLILASRAFSTPSTTYWTVCTLDIQPSGIAHLGVDDYFRIGAPGEFPTNIGPEWGVDLSSTIAMEYGVDLTTAQKAPLFFNAKLGYRENVLSRNAPALQLGFFNFGTAANVTNQNIVDVIIGKTLPGGKTRLSAAYYFGNPSTLISSTGEMQNTGYMVAFDHQLVPGKWVLAGDYASGNNAIGGGGVGAYYYFTKDISILVGPVWFNDEGINGEMKWTTQFDINF
jgi:hypothetical protein